MKIADYLILGNSAAAIQAIEAIRRRDTEGTITLVAAESEHTYSRPLITYRLAGKVSDEQMDYRRQNFYEVNKVDTRLGISAERVDTAARVVKCSDGQELPFKKLLIATGGSPIRPPIKGLEDCDGVFNFTTWADQRGVEKHFTEHGLPNSAAVLGGGLIGLKTVEALVAREVPVTLIELADRVLPSTMDKQASLLAEKSLVAAGVQIKTNTTIDEVRNTKGMVSSLKLSDGEEIDCDLLIVAIGVKPELGLLEGSGIETDRGILVNEQMATNIEGIYAAGDVAQALDALTGKTRPIPILPTAARQGKAAGDAMAGGSPNYKGSVAMNAVDIVGLPTISAGRTIAEDGDEVLSELDEQQNIYRKILISKNRLVGVILIGNIDRAGIFTGLIRTRLDVSSFKHLLLTDEFGMLSLPADYRAHMVSGAGIEV